MLRPNQFHRIHFRKPFFSTDICLAKSDSASEVSATPHNAAAQICRIARRASGYRGLRPATPNSAFHGILRTTEAIMGHSFALGQGRWSPATRPIARLWMAPRDRDDGRDRQQIDGLNRRWIGAPDLLPVRRRKAASVRATGRLPDRR
ncbi:hypothetical protein BZL30_4144 [Mycobacterium kansasii]|uniref:Uncharacterized protein n=1 Tax=Mycobacterium kansasii TaxID=1768 RepID=A0A1V3XBJ5_MYCKA|nr:hypothetical protein BZL30_4144 [Mycobacterium kansasii]